MIPDGAYGLFLGAVALGAVHGVEPGHGWPVAASYALDQSHKWLYGFAASFILGLGHLVSSIAMVAVFFYAKSYFELTQVNEPIAVGAVDLGVWAGTVTVGGPVSLVAGVLLILLGVREYRHGHSHSHGADHGHAHGDDHGPAHGDDHDHAHGHDDGDEGQTHAHDGGHGHTHDHNHDAGGVRTIGDHGHGDDHGHAHDHGHDHAHDHDNHEGDGVLSRITAFLPFVGGHSHAHGDLDEAADRGLWGIAWFAFLLGFAHEEEFEIIALCAGSSLCLELMTAYALTVIVGIVTLTLLLIAGYDRFEQRVEAYTDYLPVFSAAVLIVMGLGFVTGLF